MGGAIPYFKTPEEVARWLADEFQYEMKIPDEPQTPEETLELRTGDCDDFAALASLALKQMGVDNDVVLIKFKKLKMAHAICIWKDRDGRYSFISNQRLNHTNEADMESAVRKFYPDYSKILKGCQNAYKAVSSSL